MEYEFEDLAICGGKFTGMAHLEADRGGFHIAGICLDGPPIKWLFRATSSPLERELRQAIEAAIYADPHARDAWAAHVEAEKADAA